MFRCVCYTCEEQRAYDEWADAQTMFNEHARDQHEVVLERETSAGRIPGPGPAEETTESQTAAKSASDNRNAVDD